MNTITEKSLTQNHHQPTYATITQQQDPPAHAASVITRGEITDKQILIQKDPNTTNNTLESLSEKDLVAKANTTLDLMGIEAADKPPGMTFVGAKKLHNGNVLYQLNSRDAANWMKELEVQTAFMVNYGGTANIRNKLFYVLAEFVPTTFDAGSSYAHAKVEEDSTLSTGAITYSKYIKPPHLHMSSQKVAHVVFGFNSCWGANSMIESGMFIEGKHSNVRKMLTEPRRCLKCQRFGHYVPGCKATTDTCARCGEQHKTALCNVTEMASFKCANCKDPGAKGHGAVDRNCLAFKTEKDKIQERVPENKYKFFPMAAPNTWRLLNEPEPLIGNERTQQQQTNLGWNTHHGRNEYGQNFMEEWQTVRRHGRPPAPHEQSQSRYRNHRTETNMRPTDNGWPTRPVQTTLDSYVGNTQLNDQQQPRNAPTQQSERWGDQPTGHNKSLGLGPPPTKPPCREHTPSSMSENQEQERTQRPFQMRQQNINKSLESQLDLLESL
jgi:hypothetical protein